jgi:hypothetical protein
LPGENQQKARGAIRALVELRNNGGYVCAVYRSPDGHGNRPEFLVGVVKAGTAIILDESHKWRDKTGRTAILKTLRLTPVKVLLQDEHAELMRLAPAHSTICRWHSAGDRVARLVEQNT